MLLFLDSSIYSEIRFVDIIYEQWINEEVIEINKILKEISDINWNFSF